MVEGDDDGMMTMMIVQFLCMLFFGVSSYLIRNVYEV